VEERCVPPVIPALAGVIGGSGKSLRALLSVSNDACRQRLGGEEEREEPPGHSGNERRQRDDSRRWSVPSEALSCALAEAIGGSGKTFSTPGKSRHEQRPPPGGIVHSLGVIDGRCETFRQGAAGLRACTAGSVKASTSPRRELKRLGKSPDL
jgi:hypothetical protein